MVCLAARSRLEPISKVAQMTRNNLHNILTYCRLRVTNGVAEGPKSKIMAIKRGVCGYRNKKQFKTVIYFIGDAVIFTRTKPERTILL